MSAAAPPVIEQIDPPLAAQRLRGAEPPLLLDVREPWEHALCSIEGAMHLPMRAIGAALGELDPQRETIVVCHHGARSMQVAAALLAHGFARLANLRGGIDAWAREIDPGMPRY